MVEDRRTRGYFEIQHHILTDWFPIIGQSGFSLYSLFSSLSNRNRKRNEAFMPVRKIARFLRISPQTVLYSTWLLEVCGLIVIRRGDRIRPNVYTLIDPPACTDEVRERLAERILSADESVISGKARDSLLETLENYLSLYEILRGESVDNPSVGVTVEKHDEPVEERERLGKRILSADERVIRGKDSELLRETLESYSSPHEILGGEPVDNPAVGVTVGKHGVTVEKHGVTVEKHGVTVEKHGVTVEKHSVTVEKHNTKHKGIKHSYQPLSTKHHHGGGDVDSHGGGDSFAMLKKIGVQGRFLTELADRLPETVLAGYWHTRQQKGLNNPIGFFVRSLIAEYPLPLGLELLAEAVVTGKTNVDDIQSLLEARQLNVLRDELGDEATASAEFVATIGWELAPL